MTFTWKDLPGPTTRWWGLPALVAMRKDYLGAIAAQQIFGDLVRQQISNERTVDVFDPELLRQIMVDHADALIRWERGPEVFAYALGQSVLVTEGQTWHRQRRILMQAFTTKRVTGYTAHMVEATTLGLMSVQPVDQAMDRVFSHLAMDVISRTLFSAPISGLPRLQKMQYRCSARRQCVKCFGPSHCRTGCRCLARQPSEMRAGSFMG